MLCQSDGRAADPADPFRTADRCCGRALPPITHPSWLDWHGAGGFSLRDSHFHTLYLTDDCPFPLSCSAVPVQDIRVPGFWLALYSRDSESSFVVIARPGLTVDLVAGRVVTHRPAFPVDPNQRCPHFTMTSGGA